MAHGAFSQPGPWRPAAGARLARTLGVMKLTNLEYSLLSWFASRSGSEALRIQCETATVTSRDHTGVGQFVYLLVDGSAPLAEFGCAPNAPLIRSPVLPHGAGVDLWLTEGQISHLEIVTFGGARLPIEEFNFELVDSLDD